MALLSTIAAGKGPLSDKKIAQAEKWVADDWESHDLDRDAVKLIARLLEAIKAVERVEGVVEHIRPHSKLALVRMQISPDAEGVLANEMIQIHSDGWCVGDRVELSLRKLPAGRK